MDAASKTGMWKQGDDRFLVDCLADSSSLTAMTVKECMEGVSYPAVAFEGGVRKIVDIGANVGAATVLLARRFPEACVVAYEPDPRAMSLLCQNLDRAGVSARTSVIESAVGPLESHVDLYQNTQGTVMSSLKPYEHTTSDVVRVHSLPVDIVLASPPDILKVDTEGSEALIIGGLTERMMNHIKVIYLEYHRFEDLVVICDKLLSRFCIAKGRVHDMNRGELAFVNLNYAVTDHELYPVPGGRDEELSEL